MEPSSQHLDMAETSGSQSSSLKTFRLLGDLCLEDSTLYLNAQDLAKLRHLEPYIKDLDIRSRRQSHIYLL